MQRIKGVYIIADNTPASLVCAIGPVNTDDKVHIIGATSQIYSYHSDPPTLTHPAPDCCQPSVPHHGGPVRDGTIQRRDRRAEPPGMMT